MTPEQITAAQRIGLAVLETIKDAGELGAPSGILFATMQTQGCTLSQYQSFMTPIERRGFVVQDSSFCYTITKAGEGFIDQLRSLLAKGK